MTPARISRRLLRKLVKPALLWLVEHQLRRANDRADHFYTMRVQSIPMELEEHKRAIALTARRNTIRTW
jgi:hypothetical protein